MKGGVRVSADHDRPLRPYEALARLLEGNRRFVADEEPIGDLSHERRLAVAREQRPFATLVGCSDSRVGPEQLFGTGLGDLFIVRSAGGVLSDLGLGSVEFGAGKLAVPLIIVLGHEQCGAVSAAVDQVTGTATFDGALATVVERIVPAVIAARDASSATGDDLVDVAVHENVYRVVRSLRESQSQIMRDVLRSGRCAVVGAYYDLSSGRVEIIDGLDG